MGVGSSALKRVLTVSGLLLAVASVGWASKAEARTFVSVGIGVPVMVAPAYPPPPVYAPPPVAYAPPPAYVAAPPVYYAGPAYYPAPAYGAVGFFYGHGYGHRHWH
jgi:hypothetical protein